MNSSDKPAIRAQVRALLKSMLPEEARSGSLWAADAFRSLPEYAEAGLLLAFLSMPGEIDTEPLVAWALHEGRTVAVPRIEGDEIAFIRLDPAWESWPRDRFGIPTPPEGAPALSFEELGAARVLVATPGLAFSPRGARLGRGKGYYDRFLRRARAASRAGGGNLVTAGLAFSLQVLPELPMGPEDEPVDYVVTERGARPAESALRP